VFLLPIITHTKNVQEITTNLEAMHLAQSMEMVKIKVMKSDGMRYITFKFFLTQTEQFVPLTSINARQF
jgi:hypothetical protein